MRPNFRIALNLRTHSSPASDVHSAREFHLDGRTLVGRAPSISARTPKSRPPLLRLARIPHHGRALTFVNCFAARCGNIVALHHFHSFT
jgi:hypothetical protein